MKSRMKGMLLLCMLVPALALGAEETAQTKTVTIDEAVALAMENNIQLESSAIDVRMKKRAADQAWNVFLPSVQATGTLARSNNTSNPYASLLKAMNPYYVEPEVTEKDHWTAMGGLSIGLNLNLALMESLRANRQGYEAGKLTYEEAKQDTELNVRKAFYGILVQQESLKLAKGKLANSEERYKQTAINFKNGLVPELAMLQTQLAVETQKPSIRETEIALEQQKSMFSFLLGLPIGTNIELSGSINPTVTDYDADELIREHLGNGYGIASLGKNIEMMNTQIRALKFQIYTPSVSLNQSWSPVLTGGIDSSWTDKNNWTDNSGAFSVTVAFNLTNLLPFSSTGQSLSEAKDNAEKLGLAMKMSLYNSELEIRNLVEKLGKSQSSIAAMEMSVSLAQKAYKLTEQGYRAGTIEFLDLKDAENSLMQAQLGVLAEKFTYLSTVLDLEKALNTKLDGKQE